VPDAALPPCNGSPPSAPFCDPSDSTQAACYTFEANADDGSQYGNDGTGSNVSYEAGHDGQAVRIAAMSGSRIEIPDDNTGSLDITGAHTIEAWLYPDSLPSSGRVTIVDNDGQYGFFIYSDGVHCSGGNGTHIGGTLTTGVWQHVVCSIDTVGQVARIFIDGQSVLEELHDTGDFGTDNTNPVMVGAESPGGNDNFDGLIDSLRFWSVARSADDICWTAQP